MATEPIHAAKACTKCGVEKPHDQANFTLKLGKLTPLCRDCSRAKSKAYFQKNREQMLAGFREARRADPAFHRERQKRYRLENLEAHKAADKRYREANREKRYAAHREWSRSNPDKVAAYGRVYQQSDAGKANCKKRSAAYWSRHRDSLRETKRKRYYANHEKTLAYQRRYYVQNKERLNALARQWYRANFHKIAEWMHKRRIADGTGENFSADDVLMIIDEQGRRCCYCAVDVLQSYEIDHFIPLAKGGGHAPTNIVIACMPCNRSKGSKFPWVWRPELFSAPP